MKTLAITMMLLLIAATPVLAGGASVAGSTVNFVSFDGTDLVMEICNASDDAEWHVSSTFTLASCLTVTAASYDDGELTHDYVFSGLGTNVVVMSDNDAGYGELWGGQCLFVTLTLEENCGDEEFELCYDWDFVGDIWGADPHTINGTECTGVVGTEDMSLDSIKSMFR